MTDELICQNCKRWVVVQMVQREVPDGRNYNVYLDSMECGVGHEKVWEHQCPDFKEKAKNEL